MKLDRGHATVPVPCPIQSSPTARANRPAISRNLRMHSSPRSDSVGTRHDDCRVPKTWRETSRSRGSDTMAADAGRRADACPYARSPEGVAATARVAPKAADHQGRLGWNEEPVLKRVPIAETRHQPLKHRTTKKPRTMPGL